MNIEDCYLPSGLVPEQASQETGTEDDVIEEGKKRDKITARDLRLSSSEDSEERTVLKELKYKLFPVLISSVNATIFGVFLTIIFY